MLVRECMSYGLRTVAANDPVQSAAEQMRRSAIGCLPVISAGRVIGVLTDRDIVVRCVAPGLPPSTPVRQVMSAYAITCFADEPLEKAVDHMIRGCVRRLVVLDRNEDVVGLLSVDDIAVVDGNGRLAGLVLARTVEERGTEIDGIL